MPRGALPSCSCPCRCSGSSQPRARRSFGARSSTARRRPGRIDAVPWNASSPAARLSFERPHLHQADVLALRLQRPRHPRRGSPGCQRPGSGANVRGGSDNDDRDQDRQAIPAGSGSAGDSHERASCSGDEPHLHLQQVQPLRACCAHCAKNPWSSMSSSSAPSLPGGGGVRLQPHAWLPRRAWIAPPPPTRAGAQRPWHAQCQGRTPRMTQSKSDEVKRQCTPRYGPTAHGSPGQPSR